MVSHHPWEGHQGWSPTRGKCTTDLEISTYTLLAKLTPDVTAMDGHPTEGSVLQTYTLQKFVQPLSNKSLKI